jgi:hypothetical protein
MAGTTGTHALGAQVKPQYPKPKKRKARPWSSQNKPRKK